MTRHSLTVCSCVAILLLPAWAGCGSKTVAGKPTTTSYRPADFSGTIDKALPPAVQAKQ